MTFYPSHYRIVASVGLAAALAAVPAFAASAAAADDVTLAGCLVKAEGDGNPYLLINTPAQPALNQTPSKPDVSPSGVGTTAEFRTVFYWLEGDRELVEGVEVFRRLYAAVGFGPVVALTRLPGVRGALDAGYRWFAKNRQSLPQ